MACRSPFSSKTPTGRRHSSRRLRPTLGSSGGVAQESSPCCRKPSELRLFLTPIATWTSRAQSQWKLSIEGCAGARESDQLDQGAVWAIHGLESPNLPYARRTGLRSAAAFRKPQGTAAPAPDPDPGGRRTLAAKSKFPCFLTNCVINGIAPRGHPTARFQR
jgi:hypothetical protein